MKVISKPKHNYKEFTCTGFGNGGNGCGAVLGVKNKDLVFYPGVPGDSWGSREAAVSFKCPLCNTCTDIGRNYWPNDFRNLTHANAAWYKNEVQDNGPK